ncbi:MAG: 2Fe-2S iron-sulfur cluster binding domain-containing protein [Saprospiraceae bacterium]|nr:2Fe-2S iron-sulfur cluster binding domain-containing protein [Saprospiraceae bacterium]
MDSDIQISITDRNDKTHMLEVPSDIGMNLMELCNSSEISKMGICGGIALCGSCQVYIESDHELTDCSNDELSMLDNLMYVKSNSRLACQIKLNNKLNGLKVRIAPDQ